MRTKKICLALASAFAATAAGNASALTLNNFDAGTVNVFTAGATAFDGSLRDYLRYICVGGVDEFRANVNQSATGGFTPAGNIYSVNTILQSAYFCTLRSDSRIVDTTLHGKKLLLRKSSGDSGEGVVVGGGSLVINFLANPVTDASADGASNYTCTAGTSSAAAGSLGTIQQWSCTAFPTTSTGTTPAGFSDVEFSLMNQVLVPALSPTQLAQSSSTTTPIAAQIFGVVVTKKLRDALQVVQGLTSGDDNETQMPSLRKSVVAALYTGNFFSWDSLTNSANTPIGSVAGVTAPAERLVHVARRPDSSGSQMSMRVMSLNNVCTPTQGFAGQTVAACGTSLDILDETPAVSINQGTGNLLSCLTTLDAASKWGIGLASTSNRPKSGVGGTDANWRYIKVDGAAPTLLNATLGRYEFVTEGVLGWNGSVNNPTGDVLKVLQEFSAQLDNPVILAGINGGNATQNYATTPWFAGVLTPGSSPAFNATYPITEAGVNANPVMLMTKSALGANSCQPHVMFNTVPVQVQ
ncbi:MAG: hypothetical protein ACKVQA_19905 [Burkholderiales bacterium]